MNGRTVDVAIVGGGLVGMTAALACADRGLTVALSAATRPGSASGAAAGMLAPSTEGATAPVAAFASACRDAWPPYLDQLAGRSGRRVALNRLGILQVPADEGGAGRLRAAAGAGSDWLTPLQAAELEPGIVAPLGALLHERDGAVDNEHLLLALDEAIGATDHVASAGEARGIRLGRGTAELLLADGGTIAAGRLVVAAGAWVSQLEGLPRAIPVVPVRGQMIGFAAAPVRHVIHGPGAYVVPRPAGRTIVGATMEHAGFDAGTSPEAATRLADAAGRLAPGLAGLPVMEHWAGLRPTTPDQLPILGPDPEHGTVLYACGHSRNGILMAPLTAECIAALASGVPSPWPLEPFSVARFG